MRVGVVKETFPGERRVALVPAVLPALVKAGGEVLVEAGAGQEAGFPDQAYGQKGAEVVAARGEVFSRAEVLLQVRAAGANPERFPDDLESLRPDQVVIAMTESLAEPGPSRELAERGVTLFSMELIPRITRAQSMDVLSAMATISGYKAVLLAAAALPRLFPMLMTAAGTVTPARVFVVGAGVAGLQAIATARRLGAKVEAYDIRPAVKEQVESVGARFVQLALDSSGAEDEGGYARVMDEEFYGKQREMMAAVVGGSDVVITTAAVPGQQAPVLITREMVAGMAPGSVIVDLAAERGGNCEVTRPGETVLESGVSVLGPLNLPSTVPHHASQMYAKNVVTFLLSLVRDATLTIDLEDQVVRETLVARGGEVVHDRVREVLAQATAARGE